MTRTEIEAHLEKAKEQYNKMFRAIRDGGKTHDREWDNTIEELWYYQGLLDDEEEAAE